MFLRVVVHAGSVKIADVVPAPGIGVVDVAVGPSKISEGLCPIFSLPELERVVDGVARLVAQIHQHFFAGVLEEVVVHELPQKRIGEVPRYVHAGRAVRGPEVIVAEVVRRDEGDALGPQLAGHFCQTFEKDILDLQREIADPCR